MAYVHIILISAVVIGFLLKGDVFTAIFLLTLMLFETLWDHLSSRHSKFQRSLLFLIRIAAAAPLGFFLNASSSPHLLNISLSIWLLNALLAFVFLALARKINS